MKNLKFSLMRIINTKSSMRYIIPFEWKQNKKNFSPMPGRDMKKICWQNDEFYHLIEKQHLSIQIKHKISHMKLKCYFKEPTPQWLRKTYCYGLKYVISEFLCWRPIPQYVTIFGGRASKEVIKANVVIRVGP